VNGSFVLGFDRDGPDVFARTADWIEENHLECATFHILTPYPGTPLFRQMEGEGRLLHRDWSLYDTAHVVFKPKRMTERELAEGYAWCYRRLFGHRSIWRRRPEDPRAVLPYLAMAYSLQARETPLGVSHPEPVGGTGVAPHRGADAAAAPRIPPPPGGGEVSGARRLGGQRRRVACRRGEHARHRRWERGSSAPRPHGSWRGAGLRSRCSTAAASAPAAPAATPAG
jgi:hypothetical protein